MIAIKEPLQCDVLVCGGGIAGMMAAIDAADAGASVIVAEKANTKRSGSGATGNDHFQCYIPEVHGTEEDWLKLLFGSQEAKGKLKDMDLIKAWMRMGKETVLDWDNWGIPMKPHGDWEFTGHTRPGRQGIHLKYAGRDQKIVLTKEALKRGVKILNRTPLTEIITNDKGEAIGAICIDLNGEEPAMQVIRAKAIFLGTGDSSRVVGTVEQSGWMFNQCHCAANTGGGAMAAYRAGGELIGIDNETVFVGVCKFFYRGGKATWVGVYTDIDGKPAGPYVTKPDWRYGDFTADVDRDIFYRAQQEGNPLFMNCAEGTDKDIEYMRWGLDNEGNSATLPALEEEGFDIRKHMVEFGTGSVEYRNCSLRINANAETTVPYLYAGGNLTVANGMGGISGAAIMGRIGGRNAAAAAKTRDFEAAEDMPVVNEAAEYYSKIWNNEVNTETLSWKELNLAVMQTVWNYVGNGVKKSDKLYEVGLHHLHRLMGKLDQMHCSNVHEFMRCLEVRNIAQLAECIMVAGKSRKESRGKFVRADYPEQDPMYDGKFISVHQANGHPVAGLYTAVKEAD
ncbi:MAG: FAD-dependent oxidoreductase [Oscillospiraceae bacterium]